MNRKYSIDCSLNDEYETRIQIEMRLSYDRHDDEVDDDVNVDR
jgi:hypothetical protein